MNDCSLVTIGVASFNNAKFIPDTLNSISKQTFRNFELIIVDDCSSDDSAEIITDWLKTNSLIRSNFIKNSSNKGITKVFNQILNSSKGEYLTIIGSDDLMYSNRIEKQFKYLETNKDIDVVFSEMSVIDFEGKVINPSFYNHIGIDISLVEKFIDSLETNKLLQIIRKNIVSAPTLFYRKERLVNIGGWNESLFFEDLDMNLRFITHGYKFGFIKDALVQYRKLDTSMSQSVNSKYYDSILLSIMKYKGISKEINEEISDKMRNYSRVIYQINGRTASKWLYRSWLMKYSLKTFIYLCASFLGIRYTTYLKFKRYLSFNTLV